jgi:hypothetical protein
MTFPVRAILVVVGLSVSISNIVPMLLLPSQRTHSAILASHQSNAPTESSQETSEGELLEEGQELVLNLNRRSQRRTTVPPMLTRLANIDRPVLNRLASRPVVHCMALYHLNGCGTNLRC